MIPLPVANCNLASGPAKNTLPSLKFKVFPSPRTFIVPDPPVTTRMLGACKSVWVSDSFAAKFVARTLNSLNGGVYLTVFSLIPIKLGRAGNSAASWSCGLKVRADVNSSMLSLLARGQKPVFRTLSDRAMHSRISPDSQAWILSAGTQTAWPGSNVMKFISSEATRSPLSESEYCSLNLSKRLGMYWFFSPSSDRGMAFRFLTTSETVFDEICSRVRQTSLKIPSLTTSCWGKIVWRGPNLNMSASSPMGLKPTNSSNLVNATAISGLWLVSPNLMGSCAWSFSANFLSGCSCRGRAFAKERIWFG